MSTAVADESAESRWPHASRGSRSAAVGRTPPERAWCLVVPHHARGARMARHRLCAELAELIDPPLLADVTAVVAELVGNAVRHAAPLPGGVLRVAWRLRPASAGASIEVRVTDGGAVGAPRLRAVDADASDGRGLAIVAALAEHWGVDRDGLGQSVWARLSPAPASPAVAPAAVAPA